jgi:hypothetical protein
LRCQPTPFKLKHNIFNSNIIDKKNMLFILPNIKKELEIRIAHRIYELSTLPYGFSDIDKIEFVKNLYID